MLHSNTTAFPASLWQTGVTSHRAANRPGGAANRLFKAFSATLMVLSIVASVLLAVALSEPAPAAAQTASTTTTLTIHPQKSVDQLGEIYTIVPSDCTGVTTTPPVQTEADGARTTAIDPTSQQSVDNIVESHTLDNRCSWTVHFCASNQVDYGSVTGGQFSKTGTHSGDAVIGLTPRAGSTTSFDGVKAKPGLGIAIPLEPDPDSDGLRYRKLTPLLFPGRFRTEYFPVSALSVAPAAVIATAADATLLTTSPPTQHTPPRTGFVPPCTRVAVAPETGSTSATAAMVNYSLTPQNCLNITRSGASLAQDMFIQRQTAMTSEAGYVAQQVNADGFLDSATGTIIHQLPVDCDWNVEFCRATVKVNSGDTTHSTDTDGAFTLNRNWPPRNTPTAAKNIMDVYEEFNKTTQTRLTSVVRFNNDNSKPVDKLLFSNPVAQACGPAMALHANFDSGAKGDGFTNNNTPRITVRNVTAEASVALTATKGSDTASATADVPAGATSVDVDFTETLGDGEWTITGTHTPSGSTTAAMIDPFTLNVDTMKPTVEISADPSSGGTSTVAITFEVSEEDTDFGEADVEVNEAVATLTGFAPKANTANTWEATLTAVSAGTSEIEVAEDKFADKAGNKNAAPVGTDGTNGELHIAVTAPAGPSQKPTVKLKDAVSDTGSSATDGETKNTTPTFTVEVANAVTGASLELKAVKGTRTLSQRMASVSGTSFDFNFSGTACTEGGQSGQSCDLGDNGNDGAWTVTAELTESGKEETASDDFTVTIDTAAPTMTIGAESTSLDADGNTKLTFTANEEITGFAASGITLTPASGVATLTGFAPKANTANTWEATLTGTGSATATVTVSIAAGAFTDIAGTSYGTSSGTDGSTGALQVSFTGGPDTSISQVKITSAAGYIDGGLTLKLAPKSRQILPGGSPDGALLDCTPTSRTSLSQAAAKAITTQSSGTTETYSLGRGCDWELTFGSANAKCWTSAVLETPNGDPISFLPGGASPYQLNAAPGKTATIYLTSHDAGIRHTLLTETVTKRFEVGEITLRHCTSPHVRHSLPVIDETPAAIDADYSFVPVACISGSLPPVQTKADGISGVVFQNDTGTVFELSYLCDWDFIFSDSNSNCKVEANVNAGNHPRVTSGKLRLLGDLPQSDAEQAAGQTRYINQNLHYNYGRLAVYSIILTENSSAAGDCASEITFTNKAQVANQTVTIGFDPKVAGQSTACSPNDWAAGPPGRAVTLAPGESQNLLLADNCDWHLMFRAGARACAMSIRFKDANAMPIGSMPLSVATGATSHEGVVFNNPLRQGLSYTPRGGGSLTVVGSVEIDACVAGAAASANTHKVTVIDEFLPRYANAYSLTSQTCTGAPNEVKFTAADAIVTGNQYVHYLDYRCDWKLSAPATAGNLCTVKRSLEALSPATVHHSTAATADLVLSGDATGEKITYSTNTNVVDVVRLSVDNSDNTCMPFVNISTPLSISVVSVRSEDYSAAKQNFDIKSPQIVLNLVAHDGSGAACTPGSGSFMPNQGSGNSGKEPGNIITVNAGVPNVVADTYTPGVVAQSLDRDCDWRVEFHSAVGELLPDDLLTCQTAAPDDYTGLNLQPAECDAGDQLTCSAAAQVLGTDGTSLGNLVGDSVNLTGTTNGFTYPAADGTATPVGSIEFSGCLEADNPGTSLIQIYDDSGAVAGDFSYTITPVLPRDICTDSTADCQGDHPHPVNCEGDAAPATQTKSDGVVFAVAPGVYQHLLSHACDWEVTFTGASACEAVSLWSYSAEGSGNLEYLDTLTAETDGTTTAGSLQVTLRRYFAAGQDSPGFVYFPGSAGAGMVDPRDPNALSLPPGNNPGADQGGGLKSNPGNLHLNSNPDPADSGAFQRLNALSLECASEIDFSMTAGMESPGIELLVTADVTPVAADGTLNEGVLDCVAPHNRLAYGAFADPPARSAPRGVSDPTDPQVRGIVASQNRVNQGVPTSVTVLFSEPVTGFALTDISIATRSGYGRSGVSLTDLTGSGDTYSFKFSATRVDSYTLSLGSGRVMDADSNGNEASSSRANETILVSERTTLESGDQPFSLALNRDCGWNVEFGAVGAGLNLCRASAKIMSAAASPTELAVVHQTSSSPTTIDLTGTADGVMYTPENGSATAVGAIEFYNCFSPSVSVRAPFISGGTVLRFELAAVPGSEAECRPISEFHRFRLGSGRPVQLSNSENITLYEYFASADKIQGLSGRMRPVADDGSLCEYTLSLPASSGYGVSQGTGAVLSAESSTVSLFVQPLIELSLENKTLASGGSLSADQRKVEVTLIPEEGCATAPPAVVTLDPAETETVTLGVHPCGWALFFQNTAADCEVSTQQKNRSSNVGSAIATESTLTAVIGIMEKVHTRAGEPNLPDPMKPRFDEIEFTVNETCATSTIPVTFSITGVTDDQNGNFESVVVVATVAPTSTSSDKCSTTRIPLRLGSDNTASYTQNLVKLPSGVTTACAYDVTFAARKTTKEGVVLNRNANATATVDTDGVSTATASATYTAVYSATVKLENATPANHAAHKLANMAQVVITPPASGGCAAASEKSKVTLDPGATRNVTLGLTDCSWTIRFENQLSNCQVSAQAYDADDETVGSAVTSTTSGEGSLMLRVNSQVTKLGDAEVSTVKFTVDTTGANCTTFFDGTLTLTVTDTGGENHRSTVLKAEVGSANAACSDVADVDLTLGTNAGNTTTVTQNYNGLIDTLWATGAECSYAVTLPPRVSSTGPSLTAAVDLERASVTPSALSDTNKTVTAAYNAVRPATVTLKNETSTTSSGHSATQRNVRLIPGTPNTCLPSDTATIDLNAGSPDKTMSLTTAKGCSWTIAFRNQANDCQVTAQLKQPDGTPITPANTSGSLTLYTNDSRQTVTALTNGTQVGSVEFTVGTCTTTFNGTLSVTVTDDESADHNGTTITVRMGAAQQLCSDDKAETITLPANTGTTTSGTATVSGLIDKPWNGPKCVYTVAFPGSVNSMAGTGSEVQLRTSNTVAELEGPTGDPKATATAAYTATRAASLDLNNVTSASSAHTPTTRRNVVVTPGTGTCTPDPSSIPALNAGASQSVSLGTTDCTWSLSFRNTASDCVVEAQPKGADGISIHGAAVRGVSGTLQFSVDGDDREVSSGGLVVGAVDFTVTNDCDATFPGSLSLRVTDEISQDSHTDTVFSVSISSAGGVGCTATQTASLKLLANNTASATVAGLVAKKAGTAACSYSVSFPSAQRSAGNGRIRLVLASATGTTLTSGSRTASAVYTAQFIPDPPVLIASVYSAGSVTEGDPLVFRAALLGPAPQAVQLGYTVSGLGDSATTGTATINTGQTSTEISVPTTNDDLDNDDQIIRVTLTSATGASINPSGRTATGLVKDDDASPVVSLGSLSVSGDRLRFTVELSEVSGRQVKVSYTSAAGSGIALIEAGQEAVEVSRVFDSSLAAGGRSLTVRLTSAQNASLDLNDREGSARSPSHTWQFHVVSRAGTQPSQIAESLSFGFGWSLFSWSDASQRWIKHTAASGGSTRLSAGTTIVFRGGDPSEAELDSAGLGRPARVTLRQGWNIFAPAEAATGLTTSDFQRTANGGSAAFFDTRLIDCDRVAGVVVIYTYDQLDARAQNGFRIALPLPPAAAAHNRHPRDHLHRLQRHHLRLLQQHHPGHAELRQRAIQSRLTP